MHVRGRVAVRKAFKASLRPAFLLVVLVLLAGQHAPPLGADSISEKKEQARQVEQQLNSLQSELNRLTSELSRTESRIATLQANIQANQAQLAAAEAEYGRWQGILSERLVTMYKEGGVSAIDVLLECDDFDTFINSYDYMSRIGNHDADTIKATQELMAQIRAKRAELDSAKAEQEAYSRSLQSQRGSIQSKLNEQKAILAGIDAEVASLLSSRYGGGGGGGDGGWNVGPVNGLYFPVAGPCSFTNDWGAPRSVGRTHKGCDIMANYGTPCVAVTSGTVVQRSGGNAGLYVFLYGDNGHLYYYMHLQSYGASGRVSGGQVIGYVGDTGNARGCPHLHFEFHPNGGGAVNPYPLLVAIRG
ncbi:MAG: peptidoglycan DD-metalloendopeptidase family protein [Actinomycetota bacterium]|nr:peptidoglycan DD-metalloendopeptidase family protein [Actinomycetota bacterium]MDD5666119.1 peptidoglycan DD-metalloendopeptidase family protein [Actinomycetota bacterium]